MTIKKAKKRLTDISFEKEGCALALVGPIVGGPANGHAGALVMKSTSHFSEEFIEKAQQIQVKLDIPDFLRLFFHLYGEEAELLAAMLGYVNDGEKESDSYDPDSYFWDWWYKQPDYHDRQSTAEDRQKYISEKLNSIKVIKSLNESDSYSDILSKVSEDEYLGLLKDIQLIEKCLDVKESVIAAKEKSLSAKTAAAADIQGHAAVVAKATKADSEDKTMTDEVKNQEEMIEKSKYESVLKQMEEQAELIQKAKDTIAEYERKEKEAVAKSRKEILTSIVESEDKVEAVFKAVGELDEEKFASVVEVMKSLKTDSDEMFRENGAGGDGKGVEISPLDATDAILKQKYKN